MKTIKIIYIIFSILLALFLIFCIVDNTVSLKYEIYEYRIVFDKEFVPTERAEDYLLRAISALKFFLYYVLVNVLLMIVPFCKKKKAG